MVKVNPRITSTKIIENVNITIKKTICAETARKILRKAGYHGRVARKKPYISLCRVNADFIIYVYAFCICYFFQSNTLVYILIYIQ